MRQASLSYKKDKLKLKRDKARKMHKVVRNRKVEQQKSRRTLKEMETGLRSRPMSEKTETIFLNMLKRTPYNVSEACRNTGITNAAVYQLRRFSVEFTEKMDAIRDGELDELEQLQIDAAKEDTSARQWVLARARRDRWGDKSTVDVSHEVREYGDAREIPTDVLEEFIRKRFPHLAIEAEAVIVSHDDSEVEAMASALSDIDDSERQPLDGLSEVEDEDDAT
jgi:hypothetical protein